MSEKTEQPTPKKLREAREKGQLAKSQEVNSAAVILTVMAVFMLRFHANMDQLGAFYAAGLECMHLPFREGLIQMGQSAVYTFLFVAGPLVLVAPLAALLAHLAQVGMFFSVKAAAPKLDKLSPKQWFNKVFSKKALLEIGKTLIKVVVLAWIAHKVVTESLDALLKGGAVSLDLFLQVFSSSLAQLFRWCALVFAAVAVVDYLLQKKMHLDQLKMSKDEVKREYKEMEGDPLIKSQRRQLHKEMVMSDTIQQTRKATVLVTNPTRIAIALYYKDEEETPLPVITAAGQGAVARKMREVAEEEGIPIMQNVPLARDLLEHGQVYNYIPTDLIQPVAEVIRWVNELAERNSR